MLSEPTKPPTICYVPTGGVHFAANASGGPGDGSLHGFYTYCGRLIDLEKQPDAWTEKLGQQVTCQICQRSEEAGRPTRELAYYRNLAGELLLACEDITKAYEAHNWSDSGVSDALYDAETRMRAAIAKARGA